MCSNLSFLCDSPQTDNRGTCPGTKLLGRFSDCDTDFSSTGKTDHLWSSSIKNINNLDTQLLLEVCNGKPYNVM